MQKNLLPNPPGHASHPTEHAQGLGADQGLIEERTQGGIMGSSLSFLIHGLHAHNSWVQG